MELNITSLIYLALRLSPLIIVCFFLLQSLFNGDIKGLFYLAGLLIAIIFTILTSRFGIFKSQEEGNYKEMCKTVEFSNSPLSYLPLSQTSLVFTFAYILTVIAKYNTWALNIPTIALFSILITVDATWNMSQGCHNPLNILVAIIIAGVIGFGWGTTLINTGYDMAIFQGASDKNLCKMNPTKFRCRLKPPT
jgi:hypothetical protein